MASTRCPRCHHHVLWGSEENHAKNCQGGAAHSAMVLRPNPVPTPGLPVPLEEVPPTTTKNYPCGCSATGPGELPDYCPEHDYDPSVVIPEPTAEELAEANKGFEELDHVESEDHIFGEKDPGPIHVVED